MKKLVVFQSKLHRMQKLPLCAISKQINLLQQEISSFLQRSRELVRHPTQFMEFMFMIMVFHLLKSCFISDRWDKPFPHKESIDLLQLVWKKDQDLQDLFLESPGDFSPKINNCQLMAEQEESLEGTVTISVVEETFYCSKNNNSIMLACFFSTVSSRSERSKT